MRPELRVVRPPQCHRQIVDQQRHDDRGQVAPGLAAGGDVDGLGARLVRARWRGQRQCLDARLQPGRSIRVRRPRGSATATGGVRPWRRSSPRSARPSPAGRRPRPGSSTLERAATRASPPAFWARSAAQAAASCRSISATEWATGEAVRSCATVGRPVPSARRPPPGPTFRRRSRGSAAPAWRPRPSMIGVTIRPGRLDLVGPGEERGVAQEGVEDQRLVGVRRVDRERRVVGEVHVHRPHVQPEARAPWPRSAA